MDLGMSCRFSIGDTWHDSKRKSRNRGDRARHVSLTDFRIPQDRYYMTWCPHGNLANLWDVNKNWLPEPFIWYFAEAFATVGMLMAQGDLDANL